MTTSTEEWLVFITFQLTSSRRGWQSVYFQLDLCFYISTHILTKRMTLYLAPFIFLADNFNSHPHEEDDNSSCVCIYRLSYFNSHPHEEDDVAMVCVCIRYIVFQLTSSRRGWQRRWKECPRRRNFNSHPHEEDDHWYFCMLPWQRYFNSHPHEEDDFVNQNIYIFFVFQLTSSRRGWRWHLQDRL